MPLRHKLADMRLLWPLLPLLGNLTVLVLLAVPFLAPRRRETLPLELRLFAWMGVIFFAYFAVRGLIALPDPGLSGTLSRILPILFFAALVVFSDLRSNATIPSSAFSVIAVLVCLACCVELFVLDNQQTRAELFAGNPLVFIAAVVPLAYVNAWFSWRTQGWNRIGHYIGLFASLLVIAPLGGGRSGYLAVLMALAIHAGFVLFTWHRSWLVKLVHSCIGLTMIVTATVLLILSPNGGKFTAFVAWAGQKSSDGSPVSLQSSGQIRFQLWQASYDAILDQPWFGYGPQNRFAALEPYLPADYIGAIYTHPHNLIYTLGNSGGVFGILIGLGFILSALIGYILSLGRSNASLELILNGLAAILFLGMTNYVLFEGFAILSTCMMLIGPLYLRANTN